MKLVKLNVAVSMYSEPVYKADHPVMALSVLKKKVNGKYLGIVREIVKREGDVAKPGFIDRSELYIVESHDGLKWERKELLNIKNINRIVNICNKKFMFFIGLEDPDIFVENDKVHVYFTIAYKLLRKEGFVTYLGHAQGDSLYDLKATKPVLSPNTKQIIEKRLRGFKEVAISPVKYNFGRMNLAESGYSESFGSEGNSTIVVVLAKEMGKKWKFVKTVLEPRKMKLGWCNTHLSPCSILQPDFLSYKDLLVCFVNGRSQNIYDNSKVRYNKFRVGLMLFNPKNGNIPWISEKPIIDDPVEKSVTFASDFLITGKDKGILYAHIDDSFIRAYEINAKKLREFLPKYL